MAVAKLDIIEQFFDDSGNPLNGGLIYTYAGGTSTPLATYTSSTGGTAHANPIVLDSDGRPPGDGIWLTTATAYKFVPKTSADVELDSIDNVVAGSGAAAAATTAYDLWTFVGVGSPPTSSELLFLGRFPRAVNFTANFSGSYGRVNTNPASSFAIDVKKNGSTVGTITIATNGAFTFATSAGASVSFVAGDYISYHAPSSADAAVQDIAITLAGTLA
jgi:hypothetical protein